MSISAVGRSHLLNKGDIPDRISAEIIFLGKHCQIKEWITLKKLLLRSLPSKLRTYFSTRHPVSKRPSLNDFEKALIYIYEQEIGIILQLPEDIFYE